MNQTEADDWADERQAFIYVIKSERFVKIGKSGNPENRLRLLQTDHPYHVSIACLFEVPRARDQRAEAYLHAKLEPRRERGEWFRLHPDAAKHAIKLLLDWYFSDRKEPEPVLDFAELDGWN